MLPRLKPISLLSLLWWLEDMETADQVGRLGLVLAAIVIGGFALYGVYARKRHAEIQRLHTEEEAKGVSTVVEDLTALARGRYEMKDDGRLRVLIERGRRLEPGRQAKLLAPLADLYATASSGVRYHRSDHDKRRAYEPGRMPADVQDSIRQYQLYAEQEPLVRDAIERFVRAPGALTEAIRIRDSIDPVCPNEDDSWASHCVYYGKCEARALFERLASAETKEPAHGGTS